MDYETEDYKVRELDGVTVVRLKNPNLTGLLEVTRIGDELKAMVDGGVRRLIIDFKHVQHIGSAALGLLIAINQKIGDAGGKLVLSHPENIEELLRVSRTNKLFKTAADPKVAVKMFA